MVPTHHTAPHVVSRGTTHHTAFNVGNAIKGLFAKAAPNEFVTNVLKVEALCENSGCRNVVAELPRSESNCKFVRDAAGTKWKCGARDMMTGESRRNSGRDMMTGESRRNSGRGRAGHDRSARAGGTVVGGCAGSGRDMIGRRADLEQR